MKRFQNMISSLLSGAALATTETPGVTATTEGAPPAQTETETTETEATETDVLTPLATSLGITVEQLAADFAAADPKAALAVHFASNATADDAALAAARTEGETAERTAQADRIKAVFALESSKGRERSAARLLQTTMSVEDIDATLADLPQGDEAAALAALAATTPNPQLGTGGEHQQQNRAEGNHGWDKVIAKMSQQKMS